MSSRNAYLAAEERQAAPALYRALACARRLVQRGERDAGALRQAIRRRLARHPEVSVDSVSVADPETLEELAAVDGPALISLAARIGRTRLIDNVLVRAESADA
jgi:pantoate--beta-alanine ligase